jgi:hypothetical protein
MTTLRRLFVLLACAFLFVPALAFVDKDSTERRRTQIVEPRGPVHRSEALDVEGATPLATRAREFVGRHGGEWQFYVDPRTQRAGLVQGSGIPLVPGRGNTLTADALAGLPLSAGKVVIDTLEPLVRTLIDANAELLAPPLGTLILDKRTSVIRDDGRLASLYFDWFVGGVRVEAANVCFRLNSGNVTQFGAPLIGEIDLDTRPTFDAGTALQRLMEHTGDGEVYQLRGQPELLIQPLDDDRDGIDYRLVWRIAYTIEGSIETWEGRLDAHSGEILGFRDTNRYARAVGGVYPRTVYDDNENRRPMPSVDVTVGGTEETSSLAGEFAFGGETVSSGLDGRFFNTSCQGCTSPPQPFRETSIGAGWIDFGLGGQDEIGNGFSTPADRNTFYHLNQIRRLALKWLPDLPWLQTNGLVSNVNISATCNAVYNGAVNFYRSGGGCNNTGEVADVVYHEWGHGLDGNTRGGDGGTGEGTADVTSMHMTRSPLVGPGFRTNGTPVRNLDKDTSSLGLMTFGRVQQGDCGSSVHCIGQVYGQTAWDLALALVARHGQHTGWRLSERLFFTSLPDAGTYEPTLFNSIYGAYINADDDDGDLSNGTPNASVIYDAFNLHEIALVQYSDSPACTRPTQPELNVNPQCDGFELSWANDGSAEQFELFRSELGENTAYFPVTQLGSTETSFVDSDVYPGLDYFYVVMARDAVGCESTVENPILARLPDQPILSVAAAAADDMPRGNRSGFPDPAEEIDLTLTLTNIGSEATSVGGTIVSLTPGVTLLDETTTFPVIPNGGSADSQDALRFETDDALVGCGDVLRFMFVPDDASGCATETSYFEVQLGEPVGGSFLCDDTPACFDGPNFAGLQSAVGGPSCAEITLQWQAAESNCVNAEISYNLYRGTDPGFTPGSGSLVASGLAATALTDTLLQPGVIYHYVVQPVDSRSGEWGSAATVSAEAFTGADVVPPAFGGLEMAAAGAACGEVALSWGTGLETCSTPVMFDIYRSADPLFTPGPDTLIGSSMSNAFVDAALAPGVEQTYIVRARDGAGNVDGNETRLSVDAAIIDLVRAETEFEPNGAGWTLDLPNDASTGTWEWGDPAPTAYQPGDDASPNGVNCWITGLASTSDNNDVDDGTTTLLSARYGLAGATSPEVRYSRWFTNDRGGSPGDPTDSLIVEASNDGGSTWTTLETVGAGTPLEWIDVQIPLGGLVAPTDNMRFRFTTADLGVGSVVEAAIDDFSLVDLDQGCAGCTTPVDGVGGIEVSRSGDDVLIDWNADPVQGSRFVVYSLNGPGFTDGLRIGSADGRDFVHEGAVSAGESFFYRVTAVDACGNESD